MANNSWLAQFRRSGWAGSGPKESQAADDRQAQGAEGKPVYVKDNPSGEIRSKASDIDQAAAMKRRMDVAGG